MRIPILAGRDFTDAEFTFRPDRPPVVIISKRLAADAFPDGKAVGALLVLDYPKGQEVEVVGVVGDVRGRPLTTDPEPWAYSPAYQVAWGTIQVRSALPVGASIVMVREIARSVDPLVTPYDIEPFGASIDRVLSEQRLFARLSGLFAAVAALLAGIGIYGMMAGAVSERRREFGIRLALGARAASLIRMVVRTSVALAVAGVVLGLLASAAVTSLVSARLYGVTAFDPGTLAAASGAIVALSVIASLVPALRAARIDPVRSLRVD